MKKNERHLCPVCHETNIIEEFDICPVCGWVSNLVQNEDDAFEDGPNRLSLSQSREWFKLKRKVDSEYTWKANASVDGNPTKDDLEKLRILVKTTRN